MMEIIKSSTSEIFFLVSLVEASIHEQDFIIINDLNKKPPEQYLAQIEELIQNKEGEIKGKALILGNIDQENYSLSPCRFPISTNAKILHPPPGLVSKILSYRGKKGIYLGDIIVSSGEGDPFLLSPDFLERHVLCVASTGAGKSYSVGVLLEEILLKHRSAAVLLFDVHNEYWGLAQPNDGKEIEFLDYEGYKPQGFLNNILLFEKNSLCLGNRFDLPKLRRLVELTAAQENSLINVLKEPLPLEELVLLIQRSEIHSSTRENLSAKINSLSNLKLFDFDLDFEALIQPGQVSIIRLDQFTDERKRNLVVNEILTQIFEKKIQGEIPREREIVLIIEEAHRFASAKGIIPRVAREGRKFGIYEILISQRPGDLPDTIIANMNTLIALRIRSDKDLTKIRLMEGISTATVSKLPHLDRGEALIVGLQPHPMKIHVRPRLSKHIDPQEDKMPNKVPRYNRSKKIERPHTPYDISRDDIEERVISETKEENGLNTTEVDPIDYKDLTNLLACKHILILHKNTGICIFEIGASMLIIDPQLVSGFLSAISGLFSELKTKDTVKERTIVRIFTEEIGDRAFEIITVEGTYSITAAILDRTPKFLNRFKQRIREFVYTFETEYYSKLESFVGVLDHFTSAVNLLDTHVGLSLTTPLQINEVFAGDVPHPILFDIINDKMNQLSSFEGIFVEEIVNQCLLDSDYNYKEILKTIITYLHEGILILKNPNRFLPHFESVPVVSPETLTKIPESSSPEDLQDTISQDEVDYLPKVDLDTDLEGINDHDIAWFTEIIPEINLSPLPDSIKEDILERDLAFESDVRLKTGSLRTETYEESELLEWAKVVTQKQFSLVQKSKNPLNGLKIILSSDLAKIACSISKLKDGDYLLVLAEIL